MGVHSFTLSSTLCIPAVWMLWDHAASHRSELVLWKTYFSKKYTTLRKRHLRIFLHWKLVLKITMCYSHLSCCWSCPPSKGCSQSSTPVVLSFAPCESLEGNSHCTQTEGPAQEKNAYSTSSKCCYTLNYMWQWPFQIQSSRRFCYHEVWVLRLWKRTP